MWVSNLRKIGFAAAAFLLVFAASPKLAGFFLMVPQQVAGPLLVFTASFMIAGGMEIIVSRPLGTRGIYVVGIATLLALSERLVPKYFEELPGLVHSLSSSPLAAGLSGAIVLSLLFRFGTRQIAAFPWSATISAAVGAFETQSKTWKVPPAITDLAASEARDLMGFVRAGATRGPEGELLVAYDGISLRLRLTYKGSRAAQLPSGRSPGVLEGVELENEEAAAFVGLRNFLDRIAADHKEIPLQDERIIIRLVYEL